MVNEPNRAEDSSPSSKMRVYLQYRNFAGYYGNMDRELFPNLLIPFLFIGAYEGDIEIDQTLLARVVKKPVSSISQKVKTMKGKGLVTITNGDPDGRRNILRLSEKGRRIYEGMIEGWSERLNELERDAAIFCP